jgi:hypothetical protein
VSWTLLEADWRLTGNKTGATRLGFALLLKFYEIGGRFPACSEEVPAAAVEYLAGLVKVEPDAFAKYSWSDSRAGNEPSAGRAPYLLSPILFPTEQRPPRTTGK